ncbi:MAG: esterase [Pseudomonadota bacterium]
MSDSSIVVSQPAKPAALVLLFHGVGSSAADLVPLAKLVARQRPDAMVVSVSAAQPSSFGSGRQWFSVAGITEESRPGRIAQAMPAFESAVAQWQAQAGVGPAGTTLIGFSQGTIMSLEATQVADLAARVIGLSGRFAQAPRRAPAGVVFRFIHGAVDPVIDPRFSVEAAQSLRALGADATAQIVPGLGHGVDDRVARLVLEALG